MGHKGAFDFGGAEAMTGDVEHIVNAANDPEVALLVAACSVATPDEVRFAAALPKTRSGKIMRRLLKQIAAGELIKGDTTTLEDINVIAQLAAGGED
jgi:acyl-CoA synthetase (AMP-forming)/AMP-acid ligase II